MCPDMRLGLALGRGWLRRLLPLRRRNAGIVGRLRRQAQLRLKFAIRATSASIRATSAAIKGVFLGKSGGGVTRRLTHIRDVAATKKNTVPNTGPLHTLKRGVSNCKFYV